MFNSAAEAIEASAQRDAFTLRLEEECRAKEAAQARANELEKDLKAEITNFENER